RQIVERAAEGRHRVAPQSAHHLEILAAAVAPALERHLEGAELLGQPPDSHAEVETAAREAIDTGDMLRRVDRVALRYQADARAEPDASRVGGEKRQRIEGIEKP